MVVGNDAIRGEIRQFLVVDAARRVDILQNVEPGEFAKRLLIPLVKTGTRRTADLGMQQARPERRKMAEGLRNRNADVAAERSQLRIERADRFSLGRLSLAVDP